MLKYEYERESKETMEETVETEKEIMELKLFLKNIQERLDLVEDVIEQEQSKVLNLIEQNNNLTASIIKLTESAKNNENDILGQYELFYQKSIDRELKNNPKFEIISRIYSVRMSRHVVDDFDNYCVKYNTQRGPLLAKIIEKFLFEVGFFEDK